MALRDCLRLQDILSNERMSSAPAAAAPAPPPQPKESTKPGPRSYSILAPGATAFDTRAARPAAAKEQTPPWSRDTQAGDAACPGAFPVSKNDEICMENEKVCIKNEKLCIKNDEFDRGTAGRERTETIGAPRLVQLWV